MAALLDIGIVASARHSIREPFAGGLEAHTHLLATGLRERGHSVTVYASADSDPEIGLEALCPRDSALDLSVAAEADPSMVARPFMDEHHAYLSLMLRLPARRHDVVQNSSVHYLPVAMGPSLGGRMVTTLHTPPTPWIESAVSIAGRRADSTFVSVSRSNARAWGHAAPVRRVVPNGIEVERWPYVSHPTPGLAAWTGRLVPEKGPHLAIRAAREAGLDIVLAGPLAHPGYYEREVVPLLGPHARYEGHLTQSETAALVGGAAVAMITPCWEEPYGLVVAEALACGTPVAAFDRGAVGEIVDGATGRLAPAGDVPALAAATLAATHLDRRACRRRAEEHCSLEAMVSAYESVYSEVAAN